MLHRISNPMYQCYMPSTWCIWGNIQCIPGACFERPVSSVRCPYGDLGCSVAVAAEVALTQDAHVNSTRPTTNFGTLSNLYVGGGNTAFLQFDLTTLPAGITASQVSKATLTLFVNRVNTGGTVTVSPVTSAWNESTVTYATAPTVGTSFGSFASATSGVYVTVDLTSLVQS